MYVCMYGGTERPPFPQTESQHNSFKVLCCGKFLTTQQFKTVVLWLGLGKRWPLCTTVPGGERNSTSCLTVLT